MKQILIVIITLIGIDSNAQTISNVTSIQQGNNALVTYDLNGTSGTNYYVKLYYSTDGGQNFSNELTQVAGDVKSGIKSGLGKKITWLADKEVNYLNGSVIFKVEAEIRNAMPKPVTFEGVTVEILNAKRSGEEITIEFMLTQNSVEEIRSYKILYTSQITGLDGKQYLPTVLQLGSNEESKKDTDFVEFVKGIPVRGQLTFNMESSEVVIPAIKIALYGSYRTSNFVFKNIAVQ